MSRRMKSSITSNVDVQLTPRERAERERDDRNDGRIQDAVRKAQAEGATPELLVAGQSVTTTYDRLAEKAAFFKEQRPSLIPIAVKVGPEYPGGFHYVLSDADYGAVIAGEYCGYCLERHGDVWHPACLTCGYDRALR